MIKLNKLYGERVGFTLIEILIVVAIIAMLASVVLIGLGPTQRVGRDARRLSDLRQVQSGLELYYHKCGYYPGDVQANSPCTGFAGAPATWAAMSTALTDSSIGVTVVPNDPTAGKNYFYGVKLDGSGYTLGAQLEDMNNQALQQSPDTEQNGVQCDRAGGLYCIVF